MALLERRMHVLVSQDAYDRLERVARAEHRSVGSVVREAIDAYLDSDAAARARAVEAFLALPTDAGPGEDWAHAKQAVVAQIPDFS
jgi:predicted transcriptional regulator